MDYPLAISPDLKIDAEEFASAWNKDSKSKGMAQASAVGAAKESYPFIDPAMIHQGLIFLAGVAGTVALDVAKDVVKDRIAKFLAARSGSVAAPPFEVIVIQAGEKSVIVVKANQS
jgi:hypothetical protein